MNFISTTEQLDTTWGDTISFRVFPGEIIRGISTFVPAVRTKARKLRFLHELIRVVGVIKAAAYGVLHSATPSDFTRKQRNVACQLDDTVA